VMTYYFMAQAIFMAKGYIKEFFELSWSGKTAEGGKSLAKAFAIIVNEFLMDVILKKVGSVMKKVKESIKATKTFARVSKVANKVIHYAGNLPGIKQLRSIGTKAGKYTIGGINKGMAKASKSLGEFREKVLTAFGFKRVWMERHGNEMQMWGEFNSKVLIMEMEVDDVTGTQNRKMKIIDSDKADNILDNATGSKPKVGESFEYKDANGKLQQGVLLDVKGNKFTESMGTSNKELEDLYDMDNASRRKKIIGGADSERVSLRKEVKDDIFKEADTGRKDINGNPIYRDMKTGNDIPNFPSHYPKTYPEFTGHGKPHPKAGQPHPKAGQPHPQAGKPRADIGHAEGQEWQKRLASHKEKGLTREEIIELENNPKLYGLEERSSNRSREREASFEDEFLDD